MGASSSSPAPVTAPAPSSPSPSPAPHALPLRPQQAQIAPGNAEMIERLVREAKPHRCASRLDDFTRSIFNLHGSAIPSRFGLLQRCFRSEIGQEPREPHTNMPVNLLPRWDPAHPQYDPDAPFNSFPKKLKGYPEDL